ncbi:MAG: SDR family oxidoreductase [Phycisphaerales bacterium]|nr:SDR family oxidoreductase [Phycisphaerales bacterium]
MNWLTQNFGLADRHAVVCGATQGIGRACALAMAHAGATVTIVGRNEQGLAKVLAEMPSGAQAHRSLLADFTDLAAVAAAAQKLVGDHGPVHVLLHNSGGPAAGFAVDAAPEDYLLAMQQHLLTGQVLVRAITPGMREAGYGRILYIGSTSVVTPIRGLGVSNALRAAMANWVKSLAGELGRFGITANTIMPGYTQTARLEAIFKGRAARAGSTPEVVAADAVATIPAGRLGTAEEIACAALFLASPAGSYINGVNLAVDGGRLAIQS